MLNIPSSPTRRSLSQIYNHFFFKEEKPYSLAIVRMLLPLILFVDMLPRWFHARELFSSDGAPAPIWTSFGLPDYLPLFSGSVVVAMMTALLFLLLMLSIGWCTRLSAIGSMVLYTYITMTDSVSTLNKFSVICSHVLMLLTFSECGIVWSIDAWQKRRKYFTDHPAHHVNDYQVSRVPVWTRRLIQLLVGIIYFGSAMTKIHTAAFFSGDQMYHWSFTELNHHNALGEYITLMSPMILVFAAYVTVVWEVLFLFLSWGRGWGRTCMIAIGTLFHMMTCFMLGLYFFPLLFCVLYIAFLEEEDIRNISLRLRHWTQKSDWSEKVATRLPKWRPAIRLPQLYLVPQPVLLTVLLCIIVLVGIEAEHQMDPYGVRRPEGRHQLVEMDREEAARLLTESIPLLRKDTVVDLSVGTMAIAQYLANPRTTFQQGEHVIVQASFCPPHPDMMVECNLYDANNALIRRQNHIITRDILRQHCCYHLDESLAPGEYYFVLESAGEKLIRRNITLTSRDLSTNQQFSPVAN